MHRLLACVSRVYRWEMVSHALLGKTEATDDGETETVVVDVLDCQPAGQGKTAPIMESRKRMCLQAGFWSGQEHLICVFGAVIEHPLPVLPVVQSIGALALACPAVRA